MQTETELPTVDFATILSRSDRLHDSLVAAFEADAYELPGDSSRSLVTFDACNVALEHAAALRRLFAAQLESSGLSMLRLQFEALLRAAWVLYAANDREVGALAAPLTPRTSRTAKGLPMSASLLSAVERSAEAPPPLKRALREFKDRSWEALNSYVHSGIHPLRRSGSGHPMRDLINAVVASNALSYATFMLLATLPGRVDLANQINAIAVAHSDCMPERHPC